MVDFPNYSFAQISKLECNMALVIICFEFWWSQMVGEVSTATKNPWWTLPHRTGGGGSDRFKHIRTAASTLIDENGWSGRSQGWLVNAAYGGPSLNQWVAGVFASDTSDERVSLSKISPFQRDLADLGTGCGHDVGYGVESIRRFVIYT